jgi:hypothetical protein
MPSLPPSKLATVIGDVIGSRRRANQVQLMAQLEAVLDWTNDRVSAEQPLRLSVGDEFQGAYRELSQALLATLFVTLKLFGTIQCRFGIAWGPVEVQDRERAPTGQSGVAWWLAREAIEDAAKAPSRQKWPSSLRTAFRSDGTAPDQLLSSFLLCRDQVISQLDANDAWMTLALFDGSLQVEMATHLNLAQSTVSSHLRHHGPYTLLRAHQELTIGLAGEDR